MAAWTCPECWDPQLCMHGSVNDCRGCGDPACSCQYLPAQVAPAGWVERDGVWYPPAQAARLGVA